MEGLEGQHGQEPEAHSGAAAWQGLCLWAEGRMWAWGSRKQCVCPVEGLGAPRRVPSAREWHPPWLATMVSRL